MGNALLAQHDWALLVMRLALGLIFIAHGWRKLSNYRGTIKWISGEGFKPGWLWGTLVTIAEFGGGILILAGLFVQPVALVLTISMMAAFWYNYRKGKGFFNHLELDLILIASLLLMATLGDGYYSLGQLWGL
jgi:putative oxidoreductase